MSPLHDMDSADSAYLKEHVGDALTLALSEICQKRPSDPISYLSQWLLKYVENMEHKKQLALDAETLSRERELAMEEKRRILAMKEEQSCHEDNVDEDTSNQQAPNHIRVLADNVILEEPEN